MFSASTYVLYTEVENWLLTIPETLVRIPLDEIIWKQLTDSFCAQVRDEIEQGKAKSFTVNDNTNVLLHNGK